MEQAGVWGIAAGLLHFIPYLGPALIALASCRSMRDDAQRRFREKGIIAESEHHPTEGYLPCYIPSLSF